MKVWYGEDDWFQTFGHGTANLSLHSALPSEKQRRKWSKEDEARDKRRTVPFGFQAPSRAR